MNWFLVINRIRMRRKETRIVSENFNLAEIKFETKSLMIVILVKAVSVIRDVCLSTHQTEDDAVKRQFKPGNHVLVCGASQQKSYTVGRSW